MSAHSSSMRAGQPGHRRWPRGGSLAACCGLALCVTLRLVGGPHRALLVRRAAQARNSIWAWERDEQAK